MVGNMNRLEALARLIMWLGKRDWGLSFVLAFVSFWVAIYIAVQPFGARLAALLGGPVFRAGYYFGTLLFPDHATPHTNGFYLVPLFGEAANFLLLMAFWFVIIQVFHRYRAEKQVAQPH
jgi:hypothetical protein